MHFPSSGLNLTLQTVSCIHRFVVFNIYMIRSQALANSSQVEAST